MELEFTPITNPNGETLFFLSTFEITNAQYAVFVEDRGYKKKEHWDEIGWDFIKSHDIEKPANFFLDTINEPEQPVSGVSWYEANAFCRWLGGRLPTEDEWELAAGRDIDNRLYPWGDSPLKPTFANYRFDYHSDSVKSHEAGISPFGIYNMAGNVSEWCSDEGQIEWATFNTENFQDSSGPTIACRVVKGGSWASSPMMLRIRARTLSAPDERWHTYGFRVVKETEQ